MRDNCTEVVLSNKRCQEPRDTKLGMPRLDGRCYYHGKRADGLSEGASVIIPLDEDEETDESTTAWR